MKIRIIYILLLFLFLQCDDEHQRIPYVYVNIQKTIDDPELNSLLIPGNYVYLTGGVNGIILYRLNSDEFLAWERTCAYEPNKNCRVEVDNTNIYCECPCCESSYLILDGTPNQGPTEYPLKSYQTSFDGFYIRIFN